VARQLTRHSTWPANRREHGRDASKHHRPEGHLAAHRPEAVSAADYSGWDGPLAACEFDAHDMAAIANPGA